MSKHNFVASSLKFSIFCVCSSEKVDFRGTIAPLNLRGLWTKVHPTFCVERVRERCLAPVFRFWISLSIPEIFAFKVRRCPKSGQI